MKRLCNYGLAVEGLTYDFDGVHSPKEFESYDDVELKNCKHTISEHPRIGRYPLHIYMPLKNPVAESKPVYHNI